MKLGFESNLETAYRAGNFTDGNGNRVWDRMQTHLHRKRQPLRWAIPLAAAVTLLVSVLSIPTARAAVFRFIGDALDIEDYLGMEQRDRPNSDVASLVQGNVPAEFNMTLQPGGEWVRNVGITIDDVLYDGMYIYVKCTMDPRGMKNFMIAPWLEEGQTGDWRDCLPDALVVDGVPLTLLQVDYPNEPPYTTFSQIIKFDANGKSFSGVVGCALTLGFTDMTDAMKDGQSTNSQSPAGTVVARFSFDASEGLKHNRVIDLSGERHALSGEALVSRIEWGEDTVTFTNKSIPLAGCAITADAVSVKPTGIDVRLRFHPSQSLSKAECDALFKAMQPAFRNGNGEMKEIEITAHSNGYTIDCAIPMEYVGNTDQLTVSLMIRYQDKAEGKPIPPNTPVVIPCPSGAAMPIYEGKYELPGSSFVIDLTE